MNMKIIFMFVMRTITMVELRTHSERIVRELKRGERMILSYRGQPLAELVPTASASGKSSPLEALAQAQEYLAGEPDFEARAEAYLKDLRADQQGWGKRSSG